jgi:hypothetical protein
MHERMRDLLLTPETAAGWRRPPLLSCRWALKKSLFDTESGYPRYSAQPPRQSALKIDPSPSLEIFS